MPLRTVVVVFGVCLFLIMPLFHCKMFSLFLSPKKNPLMKILFSNSRSSTSIFFVKTIYILLSSSIMNERMLY